MITSPGPAVVTAHRGHQCNSRYHTLRGIDVQAWPQSCWQGGEASTNCGIFGTVFKQLRLTGLEKGEYESSQEIATRLS